MGLPTGAVAMSGAAWLPPYRGLQLGYCKFVPSLGTGPEVTARSQWEMTSQREEEGSTGG